MIGMKGHLQEGWGKLKSLNSMQEVGVGPAWLHHLEKPPAGAAFFISRGHC
jgi:hypothetical protein